MRTALVSGVTGFVGSHLARTLIERGWNVVGLKRTHSLVEPVADLPIQWFDVDVVPPETYMAMRPEVVIHVAANMGRRPGADGRFIDANLAPAVPGFQLVIDNVMWPLAMLESAVAQSIPLFINTDTCIPPDYPAMRPYALSKRQFMEWGKVLGPVRHTKFANLRLCQPYGPGLRPAMFIPWLINKCREGGVIQMTEGKQLREFVYVSDVVEAYFKIIDAQSDLLAFTHFDCGTGDAISVKMFAQMVHRMTGSTAHLAFGALPARTGEIDWAANGTALKAIGWKPQVGLEEGLQRMLGALQ